MPEIKNNQTRLLSQEWEHTGSQILLLMKVTPFRFPLALAQKLLAADFINQL